MTQTVVCDFCGVVRPCVGSGLDDWHALPSGWLAAPGRYRGEPRRYACSAEHAASADLSYSLRSELRALANPSNKFWGWAMAGGKMASKHGPDWRSRIGAADKGFVDCCLDPDNYSPGALLERPPPAGTIVSVFRRSEGCHDDSVHFCWDCLTEWVGDHQCSGRSGPVFSIVRSTSGLGPLVQIPIEDSPYSWAVAFTGTA